MTTIAFIRHGVTNWNLERRAQGQSNIPLNEEGMLQAKAVGRRFEGQKWDAIYTSDLNRAKTTAEEIGKVLELDVIGDERLREVSFGDIEGTIEDERVERWGPNWKDLNLNIEKTDEVYKRAQSFMDDLLKRHEGQHVIVVSHGAYLNDLFKLLLGDDFEHCRLDNTSISIVEFSEKQCEMTLLNCSTHLSTIGEKEA